MKKLFSLLLAALILISAGSGAFADDPYAAFADSAEKALNALGSMLEDESGCLWVYKDFGDTENHFTQKAKMWGSDQTLVMDMDENSRTDPHSGTSCIRCEQKTVSRDWGGWMFLNGYLEAGSTEPKLNDGSTDGQGLNLTGAEKLSF